MKDFIKEQRGITLIALVITIIVLLILAGVAISMLSGENGILNQAVNAKEATIQAEKEERVRLAVIAAMTRSTNSELEVGLLNDELKREFGIENAAALTNGVLIATIDGDEYCYNKYGEKTEKPAVEETPTEPETPAEPDASSETGELTIASGGQVSNYRVYGNSIQAEGTPSEESPIAIQSVGDWDETEQAYKIPIKISNRKKYT